MYGDDFVSQQQPKDILNMFLRTITGGPPTVPPPGGIPPPVVPPAVAARQRHDERRDQQRKIGAQVMDQTQPSQQFMDQTAMPNATPGQVQSGVGLSTTLPNVQAGAAQTGGTVNYTSANNASFASIDPNNPYEAQAMRAEQEALNAPTPQYQSPQYVPPAKGLEYLALGLAALFPGAPIAGMATGMAQGLQQRAQTRYERAQQEAQAKYQAQVQQQTQLDRRAQIFGQLSNTQESINQRRAAEADRNAIAIANMDDKRHRTDAYVSHLSAQNQYMAGGLRERIRHDDQVYDAAMYGHKITEEDSIRASNTRLQAEYLVQAGQDRRFSHDATMKAVASQANLIGKSLTSQIAAITKNVSDPVQAQTQINQLVSAAQSQIQGLYDRVSSTHPELSAMGNLDTVTETPQTPGFGQAPVTVNVLPGGGTTYGGGQAPVGMPGWYSQPITGGGGGAQAPQAGGAPPVSNAAATHQFGTGTTQSVVDDFKAHMPSIAGSYQSQQALENDILTDPRLQGISKAQMHELLDAYVQTKHAATPQAEQPQQPQGPSYYTGPHNLNEEGGLIPTRPTAPTPPDYSLLTSGDMSGETESKREQQFHQKFGRYPTSSEVQYFQNHGHFPASIEQHAQVSPAQGGALRSGAAGAAASVPTIGEVASSAARQNGIPTPLVLAVINNESAGNMFARSKAGALGAMQLMPDTARGLGVDPMDPVQNIAGGAHMLAQLVQKYRDVPTALAAYNWGPANVDKFGMGKLPAETRAYIMRVMADYTRMMRSAQGQ